MPDPRWQGLKEGGGLEGELSCWHTPNGVASVGCCEGTSRAYAAPGSGLTGFLGAPMQAECTAGRRRLLMPPRERQSISTGRLGAGGAGNRALSLATSCAGGGGLLVFGLGIPSHAAQDGGFLYPRQLWWSRHRRRRRRQWPWRRPRGTYLLSRALVAAGHAHIPAVSDGTPCNICPLPEAAMAPPARDANRRDRWGRLCAAAAQVQGVTGGDGARL